MKYKGENPCEKSGELSQVLAPLDKQVKGLNFSFGTAVGNYILGKTHH